GDSLIGLDVRSKIDKHKSQHPKEQAKIRARRKEPVFKARMNKTRDNNESKRHCIMIRIAGSPHPAVRADRRSNQKNHQKQKGQYPQQSHVLRDRQVAAAVFAVRPFYRVNRRLLQTRCFHSYVTGSESCSKIWVLFDGGNGVIPGGFARSENAPFSAVLVDFENKSSAQRIH